MSGLPSSSAEASLAYNHALQRTRPSRSGCNPGVRRAGSLSLVVGQTMRISLREATAQEADAVAALRTEVADHLTKTHGRGHWSYAVSAKSVLQRMRTGKVFLVRKRGREIATLALTPQKPWSIDPSYFSEARRPLYLVDMAVAPEHQREGIGRVCMMEVEHLARAWPADAIRLDAYDAAAGAGGFYRRCGYHEVGRALYRKVPLLYYETTLDQGAAQPAVAVGRGPRLRSEPRR